MTLAEIKNIKKDATAARNLEEWGEAIELFDNAIAELNALLKNAGDDESKAREILPELADTYGKKGGTYRRMGNLRKALEEYRQGDYFERKVEKSTYNASNVITLGITLDKISPLQMKRQLDRVIGDLEDATNKGERGDEWWALSDLGQFYLLRNLPDKAREAYRRALKKGPTTDELIRHCQILEELRNATRTNAPEISRNIDEILQYLRPSKS